ncbi:MAG TPA: hypothetical protein VE642_10395 [Pyrinomonadaceae bacterium]|jgi:hypothetical protein|nr:hypothetical protein [Pyrinomonadaceae bacterium]
MRKQSVCAALALAVCVLAAGVAAAKPKTRTLTFGSDFWVGSTPVKAGTYKLTYDDKTGEVTIADKTTTLARTTVKVEQRGKSKAGWDVVLAPKGDGLTLVSIAFPGDSQRLVVDGATAASNSGAAPSSVP